MCGAPRLEYTRTIWESQDYNVWSTKIRMYTMTVRAYQNYNVWSTKARSCLSGWCGDTRSMSTSTGHFEEYIETILAWGLCLLTWGQYHEYTLSYSIGTIPLLYENCTYNPLIVHQYWHYYILNTIDLW